MKGQVIRGTTIPEHIAAALQLEITNGHLEPGAALRQEELAERFGVSRIPIREALRRLEDDGLVEVHPNRGAYVISLSDTEVGEIFDLRRLLEQDLLRRAIPRMDARSLLEIESAMATAARHAGGADWSRFDSEFHTALYGPAMRSRQLAIVMSLRTVVQRSGRNGRLPSRTKAWLRDHEELVAACRKGDAAVAIQILERHLNEAEQTLRPLLQADRGLAKRGT